MQNADTISNVISEALRGLDFAVSPATPITVERPKDSEHGDWTSNVALQFSKQFKTSPRELAEKLAAKLNDHAIFEKIEVAGPGFLNFWVKNTGLTEIVEQVLTQGDDFSSNQDLLGKTINLEFVSANPTGPLHIGHARWAAVGDVLGRLLKNSGAEIVKEYYFNDHGVQINRFTFSLIAAAYKLSPPQDAYQGEYIVKIAEQILNEHPELGDVAISESAMAVAGNDQDSTWITKISSEIEEKYRKFGVQLMTDEIKQSLADLGVHFDVYFNENSLYESGEVEQAISELRSKRFVYESEGATWFKSSQFGDEKDRVLVKSDGTMAYLAADLAYYRNKRTRGADVAVYMLGADHHGYVGRLKAIAEAFGDDPDQTLRILIGQMVSIQSDGEFSRLSKRTGAMVYLDELLEAVGKDALKYTLARSNGNRNFVIDLDLIAKASTDNPVFYVKYVHARCCSVQRVAAERGVTYKNQTLELNENDSELVSLLQEYPGLLEKAAQLYEPYRVCHFLETLAAAYHKWYAKNPILPKKSEPAQPIHFGRLALSDAVRVVIHHGLENIVGIDAPERM